MSNSNHGSGITVKQLIDMLQKEHPDSELYFGGLSFYRLKDRGDLVQVEFSQSVYPDANGKIVIENH